MNTSSMYLGEPRLGYTLLSACRCGRFKLLYACTDEGLAALVICKPPQSTKRLILQAKKLLQDLCGGVQYVLGMCVHEMNVSNSNPWLTVERAQSSLIGLTVDGKKATRDGVCYEAKAASLT